jgi:hypothetical protein
MVLSGFWIQTCPALLEWLLCCPSGQRLLESRWRKQRIRAIRCTRVAYFSLFGRASGFSGGVGGGMTAYDSCSRERHMLQGHPGELPMRCGVAPGRHHAHDLARAGLLRCWSMRARWSVCTCAGAGHAASSASRADRGPGGGAPSTGCFLHALPTSLRGPAFPPECAFRLRNRWARPRRRCCRVTVGPPTPRRVRASPGRPAEARR